MRQGRPQVQDRRDRICMSEQTQIQRIVSELNFVMNLDKWLCFSESALVEALLRRNSALVIGFYQRRA